MPKTAHSFLSLKPISANFRRTVFWLFFIFLTSMTLLPSVEVEKTFTPEVRAFQLEFHSLCYFALTTLAFLAFAEKKPRRLDMFFTFMTYGGILELLQATPQVSRACEKIDFTMNTIGAAIACIASPLIIRLLRRHGWLSKTAALCIIALGLAPNADARLFVSDSGIRKIVGIQMVKQNNEGYCAPATLASLLNYHGIPATQEELAAAAGSTEQNGTDVGRLFAAISTNHIGKAVKITPIFDLSYARCETIIKRYNAAARAAGENRLWLPPSGRLNLDKAFSKAKLDILKSIMTDKDLQTFRKAILADINADSPLVWGVMLGIAPEPGISPTNPPAGHLRLITGINPAADEVIYTDTWASTPQPAKSMPTLDALAITMSLHSVKPLKQ